MKGITLFIYILLINIIFQSNSIAQNKPAYNIEMIIFKYNEPTNFSAESWPADWVLPNIGTSHEVFTIPSTKDMLPVATDSNSNFLNGSAKSLPRKAGFRRLSASSLQLKSEADKLRKSPRYTVLKHFAWRQPGLSAKQAIPLRIRAGQAYRTENVNEASGLSYEVDGTIKVVLGRYLHVYTDLLFSRPIIQVAKSKIAADQEDGAPEKIIYENILSTTDQANARLYGFSVKQHRRMRSKKLHHVDHPLMGMLIYATRVEE